MQQPGQDVTVMDVGRRRFDRMNELALAIDAEVAFHAEVPLPPLLGLMHRGVARAGRVLRGRGRRNDRGVHNRAGTDGQPLRAQMLGDVVEEPLAQPVLFEQMPKLADGRFVRHWFLAQVDPDKGPQRRRVVQRLLHRRGRTG
jgi:hypothetical protein